MQMSFLTDKKVRRKKQWWISSLPPVPSQKPHELVSFHTVPAQSKFGAAADVFESPQQTSLVHDTHGQPIATHGQPIVDPCQCQIACTSAATDSSADTCLFEDCLSDPPPYVCWASEHLSCGLVDGAAVCECPGLASQQEWQSFDWAGVPRVPRFDSSDRLCADKFLQGTLCNDAEHATREQGEVSCEEMESPLMCGTPETLLVKQGHTDCAWQQSSTSHHGLDVALGAYDCDLGGSFGSWETGSSLACFSAWDEESPLIGVPLSASHIMCKPDALNSSISSCVTADMALSNWTAIKGLNFEDDGSSCFFQSTLPC